MDKWLLCWVDRWMDVVLGVGMDGWIDGWMEGWVWLLVVTSDRSLVGSIDEDSGIKGVGLRKWLMSSVLLHHIPCLSSGTCIRSSQRVNRMPSFLILQLLWSPSTRGLAAAAVNHLIHLPQGFYHYLIPNSNWNHRRNFYIQEFCQFPKLMSRSEAPLEFLTETLLTGQFILHIAHCWLLWDG